MRKDSHMVKHWSTQHGGKKTSFSFKIISFFASPLERQVAEAVRILHTGAKRILNSKGMYNRCSLPRIVAKDSVEEVTLGDTEENAEESDVVPETDGQTGPPLTKRETRLACMKDMENWGSKKVDNDDDDDETVVDTDILSDDDEETVQCLIELLKTTSEKDEIPRKMVQTSLVGWVREEVVEKSTETRTKPNPNLKLKEYF